MIYRVFRIRNWEVHLYVYVTCYYKNDILARLNVIKAPPVIIERVSENIDKNSLNTGFTYSEPTLRQSVVVIGRTENGTEFLNSYCHELRHLVDDIADCDGLEITGEKVAYLSGDICNKVSDIVCKMSCNHCRGGKS